jgi:hypothetical protein
MLDQAKLKSLLRYDPDTGQFFRAITKGVCREGQRAGSKNGKGYLMIWVDGKPYLAHRLAWLYVHGSWPAGIIDHVNMNRADNSISNLREASRSENGYNRRPPSNNKSGHKGVHWHARDKSWRVVCTVGGSSRLVGYFKEFDAAVAARNKFAKEHHLDFYRP